MRTDAELLRSLDPEAFGEFYERHVDAVAAYLGRRARQPDVVFDLLGETFARAYEHRRQHDPRKGPAIAWLLSTARYVVADAERSGQVPDAARRRIGLPPVALGAAARSAITARSGASLEAALADLPESQRIAVRRRVLTEDEYEPVRPASVRPSELVFADPEARRARDPFDLLRERLFVAAGGRVPRSRRLAFALVAAAVLLFGAGLAAAALRSEDERRPRPTPTPSPTTSPPGGNAVPTPTPNRNGPGAPGAPQPNAVPPSPPSGEPTIALQLVPDLRPGHVGWCVDFAVRGAQGANGGRGCTPAGPPDTNVIATGGVRGPLGAGYAVVDQAVAEIRLSDGRTITPELDPGMPSEWRAASWSVRGSLPTFTLHDATGRELAPFRAAPLDPLPTVAAGSRERCPLRADRRATETRSVGEPVGQDALYPSYLSCASAVFRVGNQRLRASVLLDARDPDARAPDLVTTSGVLSVRRRGRALVVVYGGTNRQRARLLRELR
jgi:RNA polymerase sigma-70 factor (ECF subfamily)